MCLGQGHTYHGAQMEDRGQLGGVVSPHMGGSGTTRSYHVWWQLSLPTEPSQEPKTYILMFCLLSLSLCPHAHNCDKY